MQDWTRHTRWTYRDMYPQLVAELFGISIDSLLQNVASGSPLYPRPDEVQLGRPTWSEHSVFSTIWDHRPDLRRRIPRLFPDARSSAAAEFVSAQALTRHADGQTHRYGVHLWSPADDRGLVAIAYRTEADAESDGAAEALLNALPMASAVVIPEDRDMTIPGADFGDYQPAVQVADRCTSVLSGWAWLDVLGLLRTDIPWWPASLAADLATILAWRPGDAASPAPVVMGRPS